MLKVYDQITQRKKDATKREAQKKEMADVIEQEKLMEVKGELSGVSLIVTVADNAQVVTHMS